MLSPPKKISAFVLAASIFYSGYSAFIDEKCTVNYQKITTQSTLLVSSETQFRALSYLLLVSLLSGCTFKPVPELDY